MQDNRSTRKVSVIPKPVGLAGMGTKVSLLLLPSSLCDANWHDFRSPPGKASWRSTPEMWVFGGVTETSCPTPINVCWTLLLSWFRYAPKCLHQSFSICDLPYIYNSPLRVQITSSSTSESNYRRPTISTTQSQTPCRKASTTKRSKQPTKRTRLTHHTPHNCDRLLARTHINSRGWV